MKNRLIKLLGLCMVLVLTGCGSSIETVPQETTMAPTVEAATTEAPTTEAPTTEAPTTEAPTTEAPTTEAPTTEAPSADVSFATYTHNFSDNNGYNYKITIQVSEWIKLSDTDKVNAAWSSVKGDPADLPQNAKDWGIVKWSTGAYGRGLNGNHVELATAYDGMTDYYYAIGTLKVTNVTDGWKLSETNTATPTILLSTADWGKQGSDQGRGFIIKTYISSKKETQNLLTYIHPLMKKDSWGPIKFIICHPENVTPAHPDGQYKNRVMNQAFGVDGGSDVLRSSISESNDKCLTFKIPFNY